MSFLDDVDSLQTRLHASSVPRPVLIGVAVLCIVVVILIGSSLVKSLGLFSSASLEINPKTSTNSESAASGEENKQDSAESDKNSQSEIMIHVAGAVNKPGVYTLPENSRVQDAIDLAGGFATNAQQALLNCARMVSDGEQIVVPSIEETAVQKATDGSAATPAPGTSASQKVNINTATLEELDSLPGIGESTAQKILDDRSTHGSFKTIEDLKRVSGIGDKKFENLVEYICV